MTPVDTVFIYENGKHPDDGTTVQVDHFVQTIQIKVRSMNGVSLTVLQDTIQQKYEVLDVVEQRREAIVKTP